MSESELRKKHAAEDQAANARLVDAMRQAGVDVLILGTGESRFDVYAERSRLFAVFALEAPHPNATRRLQRALAWDGFQTARLERGEGGAPVEFISLIGVAISVGEFSQHPAVQAWRAAAERRAQEDAAWYQQQLQAERARRRRLAPAPKRPMPFILDAFADILGFYDIMADMRSRGLPEWHDARDGPRPQRWFMDEDGLSLMVRDGHIILQDWRDDMPDDEDHPTDGKVHETTFPIPETADEAWRQLIQAGYWPDDPSEREDFFWNYREAMQRHARPLRLPS